MNVFARSLGIAASLLVAVPAWAADPVAYITEIRRGGGDVGVKAAPDGPWKPPQPLGPLRQGDQLRASGNAQIVILFHAGGAVQTVVASNSPFTIPATTPPPATEKLRAVAGGLTEFFAGKQGPPAYRRLATRDLGRSELPVIVSPRETRLLPGPVTFEWDGSEQLAYTVSLSGPVGPLWKQERVSRRAAPYPDTAPALEPGVLYTWQLEAPGASTDRARFEIVGDADANRIREKIAPLWEGGALGYPRNTIVLLRVAAFSADGLFDAARRELEAAITTDPNEPSLHLLLAHVYERIGLGAHAVRAYARVRALSPE
jgi:hypothetical protein